MLDSWILSSETTLEKQKSCGYRRKNADGKLLDGKTLRFQGQGDHTPQLSALRREGKLCCLQRPRGFLQNERCFTGKNPARQLSFAFRTTQVTNT
jgi:hypothetical protein